MASSKQKRMVKAMSPMFCGSSTQPGCASRQLTMKEMRMRIPQKY
jgi:hypothetical protein